MGELEEGEACASKQTFEFKIRSALRFAQFFSAKLYILRITDTLRHTLQLYNDYKMHEEQLLEYSGYDAAFSAARTAAARSKWKKGVSKGNSGAKPAGTSWVKVLTKPFRFPLSISLGPSSHGSDMFLSPKLSR